MNRILAIVPAYNEADNIVDVIDSLYRYHDQWDILVVNDASPDNTGVLASQTQKASVINLPFNLGVGGAIQTGFRYAKKEGYEFAFQFDGDGQHRVEEVEKLLEPVVSDLADVTIGSRFCGEGTKYKASWSRRFGIKIFEWIALLLTRRRITDCTSGFRAYNKRAIHFLAGNYPVDYPEPEAIILLGKNKFRVMEVLSFMQGRQGGKSHITIFTSPFYMIKVSLGMVMTALRRPIAESVYLEM